MTREKHGRQAVGRREKSILGSYARKRFERFLREFVVALFSRQGVHAHQRHHRNGIRPRSRGVLKRFAANIQAAERLGIGRAIEEAAAVFVGVAIEGKVQSALGNLKITWVEREFVGVEQRQRAK